MRPIACLCYPRTLIRVVALASAVLLSATPALSVADASVTTRNSIGDPATTYGNLPSRFTINCRTSGAETVASMRLVFPKGTILASARIEAVTLFGLARRPVRAIAEVKGVDIALRFEPAVAPESLLVVYVFDVVPPAVGGAYELTGETVDASGTATSLPQLSYETKTMTWTMRIESWLDEQPWIWAWNSVPILGLFLRPQIIVRSIPLLLLGWLLSIAIVVAAFPFGIVVGLTLAFMKMSQIWPIRWLANAYINLVRGAPLFLQIYIAFFALPLAGIHAPAFPLGVVVLSLNSAAYLAEIFRAGILSIQKGQFEAAFSLGMSYRQAMAFVIIPQTLRRILPTMTSEFILLFKDTALLSAVGVFELMKYAQGISANAGNVTPYLVATVYYLILTVPLISWVGTLEAKLAVSESGNPVEIPRRRKNLVAKPALDAPSGRKG